MPTEGKMPTRKEAIKLKCLDCACGQLKEVRLCPVIKCPLYPYRLGTLRAKNEKGGGVWLL